MGERKSEKLASLRVCTSRIVVRILAGSCLFAWWKRELVAPVGTAGRKIHKKNCDLIREFIVSQRIANWPLFIFPLFAKAVALRTESASSFETATQSVSF